jgi:hypothetical protein
MPRHAGILNAWHDAFLRERIAVANAAGVDFDAHATGARFGHGALDDFKRGFRFGDLDDTHGLHKISVLWFWVWQRADRK